MAATEEQTIKEFVARHELDDIVTALIKEHCFKPLVESICENLEHKLDVARRVMDDIKEHAARLRDEDDDE